MPYYLYRLGSKTSKHYYIGVTDNFQRRNMQHYHIIRKLVYAYRENKKPDFLFYPIHEVLAKQVIRKVKNILFPLLIIRWYYDFRVLHEAETPNEIRGMESLYLYEKDDFCMNIDHASKYRTT